MEGVARRAAIGCLVAAALALAVLAGSGHPRAGFAAAAGLALGSVNGALAGRALGAGMSPRASSLIRLGVLSAAAIAVGLLIGLDYVWLVILGVGAAQMVLVGMAAGSLLRR
jgi:hypothetical protein